MPERGNHEWSLPEAESREIIKQALDAGINFFDTANVYSAGSSEEIVGRALADMADRDEIVLATKVQRRGRADRHPHPRDGGPPQSQHLEDAIAAVDLDLPDDAIAALEEPYGPARSSATSERSPRGAAPNAGAAPARGSVDWVAARWR